MASQTNGSKELPRVLLPDGHSPPGCWPNALEIGIAGPSKVRPQHLVPLEANKAVHEAVLKRDAHCCRYCGFRALKYQQVLVPGGNSRNIRAAITVCIFCESTLVLDLAANSKSAQLIYAPEICQAMLNRLAKLIYVARISQGEQAEAARAILDQLLSRSSELQSRVGEGFTPVLLSQRFKGAAPEEAEELKSKLSGVRVLPIDRRIIKEADLEFNQFPQILAFWRSKNGPFGGFTPPQWTPGLLSRYLDGRFAAIG